MEIPPQVEYSLTDNGQDLIPALKLLANWESKMKESFDSGTDFTNSPNIE